MSQSCFVEMLKKLKESSKEAVENINEFSAFKKYMHIKRDVEDELIEKIKKANNANKPQLILVCGGVGDGKSHLIGYLDKKYPDLLADFEKHNDATESFRPLETSTDTLKEVMKLFSDKNIQDPSNRGKLILAINLGALNNFIDSEYQDQFTELKKYILEKKILESTIENNEYDEQQFFQFINFSDYHMFSLTERGPQSTYIKTILERVTKNTEDNPFFKAYQSTCIEKCHCADQCPIKSNYDYISKGIVQDALIQILIEAIVKEKLIISTRGLLNFIYDSIVPIYLDNISYADMREKITDFTLADYLRNMMPNIIYEHKDRSTILKYLAKVDPIHARDEMIDEIIIRLNTVDEIFSIFNDYVDNHYNGRFQKCFDKKMDSSNEQESVEKDEFIRLLLRMRRMTPKAELITRENDMYDEYVMNLYWWNTGRKKDIKKLYEDVKESIFKWNGESSSEMINLFAGKTQAYRIAERLQINADLETMQEKDDTELHKFIPFLTLKYKSGENENAVSEVKIDYALYEMLMKIRTGHRPNIQDKNSYIQFVDFLDEVVKMGAQDRELVIQDRNGNKKKQYKLAYDKSFGEYTFKEI